MPPAPAPRPSRPGVLALALSLVWVAIVVTLPLLAAWIASALAAHAGWSTRAAAASGLLVFPAVPFAWEGLAAWRRSRARAAGRRFLTLTDRLVGRTLLVSAVFIGGLLARDPEAAFVALNSRGDWMLDGRRDPAADRARRGLFLAAARFEWLYHLVDENPFRPGQRARPRPQPVPVRDAVVVVPPARPPTPAPDAAPDPAPAPRDPRAWPTDPTMHTAVVSLPAAAESSPAAVGRHLATVERDPWRLARAVHDYVADRVAYDVASYRAGVYPPQDAETTFRSRRSVCAGYAALFQAVGEAAGLTVRTVVGRARGVVVTGMGEGHAWNAVQLDGRWHLVDTTWDAGYVDAGGFHKRFATRYFLTPPEAFVVKHFPDDPQWQLLASPWSAGQFMRAPAVDPEFFAYGLRLVSPDRAESDAAGEVEVVVDNPRGAAVLVSVRPQGGEGRECRVTAGSPVTARCPLPGDDLHEVVIFAGERGATSLWSVASLKVHRR